MRQQVVAIPEGFSHRLANHISDIRVIVTSHLLEKREYPTEQGLIPTSFQLSEKERDEDVLKYDVLPESVTSPPSQLASIGNLNLWHPL